MGDLCLTEVGAPGKTGAYFYVQEKVRPGTGREAGLGHVRYAAGAGRAGAAWYGEHYAAGAGAARYGEHYAAGAGAARYGEQSGQTGNRPRDWPGPSARAAYKPGKRLPRLIRVVKEDINTNII